MHPQVVSKLSFVENEKGIPNLKSSIHTAKAKLRGMKLYSEATRWRKAGLRCKEASGWEEMEWRTAHNGKARLHKNHHDLWFPSLSGSSTEGQL